MKKFLMILVALAALVSCEEEKMGMPPVYAGFTYEPSPARAGEVLKVTAVVKKQGEYIYKHSYEFSMTVRLKNGSEQILTYKTGYQDNVREGNITAKFDLPEDTAAGTYECTFNATFENSVNGESAKYKATDKEHYKGEIISYNSTLYSKANGSVSIVVQ